MYIPTDTSTPSELVRVIVEDMVFKVRLGDVCFAVSLECGRRVWKRMMINDIDAYDQKRKLSRGDEGGEKTYSKGFGG